MSKIEFLIALLLLLGGAVRGFYGLFDPDLGWHLAGGLWILETLQIPGKDPFTAEESYWLCYSWLFEVIIAIVYKISGFRGLHLLQGLLIFSHAFLLVYYVRLVDKSERGRRFPRPYFAELITFLFLFYFHSPIWTLRPQALGALFLVLALIRLQERKLTSPFVLSLTILWANVHVFWVLMPAIVFFDKVLFPSQEKKTSRITGGILCLATVGAGFLTPYTWQGIALLFQYALQHQAANSFVFELHSLSPQHGPLFWFILFLTGLSLVLFKKILRQVGPTQTCMYFLMLIASWTKVKFILVFSLFAVPILLQVLLPILLGYFKEERSSTAIKTVPSPKDVWGSGGKLKFALAAGLIFVLVSSFFAKKTLSNKQEEMLATAAKLCNALGPQRKIVLNDFNDGGWLILAFWLNRGWPLPENNLKVSIDGRTLVQGEQRIKEYQILSELTPGWKKILKQWNPNLMFLASGTKIEKQLLSRDVENQEELGNWREFIRGRHWVVLVDDKGARETL